MSLTAGTDGVWRERDTTPAKIEAAMRQLLAAQHSSAEAFVPARVLNLVVVVDAEFRGEIENRLERVGRNNASRLILCAVRKGQTTLDAWASMAPAEVERVAGSLAVGRERIEIDIGPQHLKRLDTIVDPLVVSDLATVVWAPHGHDEAVDALRRLAQVILIDSLDDSEVEASLCRTNELAGDSYVVDLAWIRSAPWRERLAAAFDPPALRSGLRSIAAVTVRHRPDSAASAMLFLGWLCTRLDWKPERLSHSGNRWEGRARHRRGEVRLVLDPVGGLNAPGLGGVTIEIESGAALSLERGAGGLRAIQRTRDGVESEWTVLGASRGESGILGEGVRQALLRDPTYRPALAAARAMVR